MTIVYFNFPEISLPLQGIASPSSQEIQLASVGQPLSNIQINNVNYSAQSIIITSSSSPKNPGYLIVKCYADVKDTTSNLIYFVIPLVVTPPTGATNVSSDVDNIINAKTNKSETVKLTLNNYIKNGGSCVVPLSTTFPLTITLDNESAIPIQQYSSNTKFYEIGSISALAIDSSPENNKNGTLQQQDLDWIMSCELLTEDGDTEKKTQVDPGTTATTISLFMMTIVIACTTYIVAPIIYGAFGMHKLATAILNNNHYSVNVYWGITLILLSIMCIINGLSLNNPTYFFLAFGLILSYFSGTSAVLKIPGISNSEGSGFDVDSTTSTFAVYSAIFDGNCNSSFGRMIKIGIFALMVVFFICMCVSIGNSFSFVTFLILLIIVATSQLYSILKLNKLNN